MNVPADLLYTLHDEWIRREGDEIVVGITDFAQDQLGELVHVELPSVGASFATGAAVCEVESVKAVAEVYAPASGVITAVNGELDGSEGRINEDPYGSWLYRLRVTAGAELDGLLGPDAYRAKIA